MAKTYTTVPTVNPGDAILASSYNTYQKDNVNNLIVPAAVLAVRTADQTIPSSTSTAIQFNAADEFDTDAMHDTVTNNTRITINTAGIYVISATVNIASVNTNGTFRLVAIRKNGSSEIATNNPGPIVDARVTTTTIANAAVNDYFEAVVFQDTGGNVTLTTIGPARALFSAVWVGRTS